MKLNVRMFLMSMLVVLLTQAQNPAKKTTVNIQLDYFNTSSSKCIVDLFKKFENITKNNKGEVEINWLFNEDDEDMQEAGEDYQSIVKLNFNIVSFKKS